MTGSSVDQYVKCYIIDEKKDGQQSDVHYRSLRGDGNFNWRFVHRFDYLDAEKKIVYKTKPFWYSIAETEEKVHPTVNFEVWDADLFTSDDYIGSLSLDLTNLIQGAKTSRMCTLDKVNPGSVNMATCDLFKQKRVRGWYPFRKFKSNGLPILAGKVDLELLLIAVDEADHKAVGQGRDPPEPLPTPIRPETSFNALTSPLHFLQYSLWDGIKYKCTIILVIFFVVLFFAMFIYQLPQSLADRFIMNE